MPVDTKLLVQLGLDILCNIPLQGMLLHRALGNGQHFILLFSGLNNIYATTQRNTQHTTICRGATYLLVLDCEQFINKTHCDTKFNTLEVLVSPCDDKTRHIPYQLISKRLSQFKTHIVSTYSTLQTQHNTTQHYTAAAAHIRSLILAASLPTAKTHFENFKTQSFKKLTSTFATNEQFARSTLGGPHTHH